MKTGKKVLSLVLAVIMCVTSIPLIGFDFKAGATEYKVGDIIEFGSYPQSEVKDESLIAELNDLAPEWDNWRSYNYCTKNIYNEVVPGNWMRYTDVTFNGNRYRGVKFTQYRSYITTSSWLTANYSFQDNNGYYPNRVYWFKFENVNWRILDPIKGLVISENIIDSQPYSNACYLLDGSNYYYNDKTYTIYSNDYEYSSIRKWLNDDFYYTVFNKEEREKISITTLNNDGIHTSMGIPGYEEFDSNVTEDKVFLLSFNEARNSNLGFNSDATISDVSRVTESCDYSKIQGFYGGCWILRSPTGSSDCCCAVSSSGCSNYSERVNYTCDGVRPAMCVDLDAVTSSKVFPEGYDFEEDSYNFENYLDKVSEKYFTTLYEEASGMQLYNEEKERNKHGVCFGMAYTTAAFYMGYPAVNNVYHLGDSVVAETISDIYRGFEMSIGDKSISVDDYIKYAYIYQKSAEMSIMSLASLEETLKHYIEENMVGVVLLISRYQIDDNGNYILDENGEKIGEGGHAVLAVGMEEKDEKTIIYVDDSNSEDQLQTVTFDEHGNWEFSNPWTDSVGLREVSNRNSIIEYSVDIHAPYRILLTGNKTVARDNGSNSETYIEGIDRVNADKVLLNINADKYRIINEDYCKIENDFSGSSKTTTKNDLYWISTDKTVKVSDLIGDNNISLSGDNTTITANVTDNSSVTMTIDENNIEANIETESGTENSLSFETIVTDENYNNVKTAVTVKGIADGDEITATQTETGLEVTGISDGTITLTKDDEVIATQTITDAESDIEINYDKNGDSDSFEVEYDSSTSDEPSTPTDDCTCKCHKTGFFAKLIWKFTIFINKLLKKNQICSCGVAHY